MNTTLRRVIAAFAGGFAGSLLWPAVAFAGYCPNLPNCTGGSIPLAGTCLAGATLAAGLCLPQKQGGEWHDYSDDFGGHASGGGGL